MAEVRTLGLPNVSQRRRGALTAVYRCIGRNMKIGAGCNFTDFSDDLTDLRSNHKGVFFNFIASKCACVRFASRRSNLRLTTCISGYVEAAAYSA